MKARTTGPSPGEQGFSLIELLVVVGIIAIMAGIAIPSIATYIRNYKIAGSEREVSSTISQARSRAISKNTQAGVSFEVVDANTYRIVIEDLTGVPPSITLGDLHDLPYGVIFQPPVANVPNATFFRFNRLGAWCDPINGGATCPPAGFPCVLAGTPDPRCTDLNPGGVYISSDPAVPGSIVGLLETSTGLRKVIRVEPGGRVQTVPQ